MKFANPLDPDSQIFIGLRDSAIPNPVIFVLFVLLSFLVGRYVPGILRFFASKFLPPKGKKIIDEFIIPLEESVKLAGTFMLISLSLVWLNDNPALYRFIKPFVDFGVIATVAWLLSRIFRQVLLIYGIPIVQKYGLEVDETFLIFETVVNVIIGFVAVTAFAQSQNFPLTALLAGASIGGAAIGFGAQSTFEQLLGTIVLRLDRPFIRGEYVRLENGTYGRVESIGLRSTKIRLAAKGTLVIIPNSNLMKSEIENITRGKKVMVLLYLDFTRKLEDRDKALVQQAIKECTDSVFGIDPGSTNIVLLQHTETGNTRARITFFILGSSENAITLRKTLLESTNKSISKKLEQYNISFSMQEPNIYVDSPVTI
ncbi:mechanosensitive ion channel family protein [Lyngbya aestuarii BL J]|uniref:Mechanosensitive ion channel family protein n=1 Tax=Lyngbya aestuarii BL J TaxID=1348334 RepID=U7QIV8_9CYAN|nr:mechanosensitive ion channel domain-containing protein [Lyngbya aestuarii]ERT07833.1 mechanosensitive ion channel family protein [Lyngbya aestuarii BL J]